MKAKVTIFLMLSWGLASAQPFGLPEERAVLSVFVDPGASVKENGLDIGFEFGYEGVIYAKLQFENFDALQGGYTSFGAAVGGNIQQGKFREYLGIRGAKVWRNGSSNPIIGFEGGIDYWLDSQFAVGLRATADWREDMELLELDTAIWRVSGFVKLTWKIGNL